MNELPLYRSMHLLAVLQRFALGQGMPIATLLRESGLYESDLEDPDFLATTAQEIAMIRNLCAWWPEPGLGLGVGKLYHVGTLGMLGMAAMHCATLGEAIAMIERYRELIGSYFRLEIERSGERVILGVCELIDLKDVRVFVCEREFAAVQRMLQDLLGRPLSPEKVTIAYPRPPHHEHYVAALGCPVVFGAVGHAMTFDAAYLDISLPLANPLARKACERACQDALARMRASGSISQWVAQEIVFRRGGIPDLATIAKRLHLSERTLRRRLREEGRSYRDIVMQLRMEESARLLRGTSKPILAIAHEVGYQDLPNFYRAFRRWAGMPPGDFRSQVRIGFVNDG